MFETAVLEHARTNYKSDIIGFAGGSYRRGKSTCGDVDFLFTHTSWVETSYKSYSIFIYSFFYFKKI